MKFNAAVITLALAHVSYAQEIEAWASSVLDQASSWLGQNDINTVLSSGLDQASSWLAENDVNTIVSGALAQVSSFVDNNDLDQLVSAYGAPIGITDAEGISSVLSAAESFIMSATTALVSELYPTSTQAASAGSAVAAEATPTETGAAASATGQPAIETFTGAANPGAGASEWTSRAAVVAGSFFLGMVAYL